MIGKTVKQSSYRPPRRKHSDKGYPTNPEGSVWRNPINKSHEPRPRRVSLESMFSKATVAFPVPRASPSPIRRLNAEDDCMAL
jgi:hypothetical protein